MVACVLSVAQGVAFKLPRPKPGSWLRGSAITFLEQRPDVFVGSVKQIVPFLEHSDPGVRRATAGLLSRIYTNASDGLLLVHGMLQHTDSDVQEQCLHHLAPVPRTAEVKSAIEKGLLSTNRFVKQVAYWANVRLRNEILVSEISPDRYLVDRPALLEKAMVADASWQDFSAAKIRLRMRLVIKENVGSATGVVVSIENQSFQEAFHLDTTWSSQEIFHISIRRPLTREEGLGGTMTSMYKKGIISKPRPEYRHNEHLQLEDKVQHSTTGCQNMGCAVC